MKKLMYEMEKSYYIQFHKIQFNKIQFDEIQVEKT